MKSKLEKCIIYDEDEDLDFIPSKDRAKVKRKKPKKQPKKMKDDR